MDAISPNKEAISPNMEIISPNKEVSIQLRKKHNIFMWTKASAVCT